MLNGFLSLTLYEAKVQDDQAELIDISQERNLKSKYSQNTKSQIQAEFAVQKEEVENQIGLVKDAKKALANATDQESKNKLNDLLDQYDELVQELRDIKDQEDKALEQEEKKANAYEIELDQKQTTVENDLQAATAQRDAVKETVKQRTEESFKYFQ